jgi:HK97 gp10 family phage protein
LGRRASEAKVLGQALRPGARLIANAAKSGAPKATGALARSIVVAVGRSKQRGAVLTVGHRKDDPTQRWRIAHIIEYGSRYVGARAYMRPAHQANAQAAITEFGRLIWQLISKELVRVRVRQAVRRR